MKNLLAIFLLAIVHIGFAQNLVENGSFENKSYCPSNYNLQQLKSVVEWSQLNEGTPDHFAACSDKVGVPKNIFGFQSAQDGEAYVGMATYSPTQKNYREYLTSKLKRPLHAGEMVCIEMYLSTADYSKYITDGFGLVLSEKKLVQDRTKVIHMASSLTNPRLNLIDAFDQWILVSDTYTAKGGEEYITIGNFKNDREMKILSRTQEEGAKEDNRWSYVYVDNIKITPIKERSDCSCENDIIKSLVVDPPLQLSEYEKISLDAVYFDFDKSDLTEETITKLEEVYLLLRKNRAMYLEIDGHTDIIGAEGYNVELSKKRAQTVIDYLVAKGIDVSRLTIKYFGSSTPATDNETSEGRARNRRVEFQVLQKKYELVQ